MPGRPLRGRHVLPGDAAGSADEYYCENAYFTGKCILSKLLVNLQTLEDHFSGSIEADFCGIVPVDGCITSGKSRKHTYTRKKKSKLK